VADKVAENRGFSMPRPENTRFSTGFSPPGGKKADFPPDLRHPTRIVQLPHYRAFGPLTLKKRIFLDVPAS
jgi:hypothetical protein